MIKIFLFKFAFLFLWLHSFIFESCVPVQGELELAALLPLTLRAEVIGMPQCAQ